MNEKISRKLTLLSLVMTLAILIYHMDIFYAYEVVFSSVLDQWIYRGFTNIFRSFGSLALGYFFMVSSFLLYWNLKKETVRKKVVGRITSLGIPFVIWNMYALVFYVLKDGGLPICSSKDFLLTISVAPVNGPLWYVFVLILFLAFIPLGMKLREFPPKRQWVVLGFCTILSLGFSLAYHHVNAAWLREAFWLERIVRYIPAYMLGIVLASDHGEHFRTAGNQQVVARIVLVFTVLFIIFAGADDGTSPINYLVMRAYPVAFWYVWESRKVKPLTHYLFSSSFFYYAAHEPIIITLYWILSKVGLPRLIWTGTQIVGLWILFSLLVVGFLTILVLIIHRISKKCLNVLLGGRIQKY